MPLQEGRKERAIALWRTGGGTPLRFRNSWPVAIDFCVGRRPVSLPPVEPAAAGRRPWNEAKWRLAPTPIHLPLLNSAPEQIHVSAERLSPGGTEPRWNSTPKPMPAANLANGIPPVCERWATAPAADPVADFVRPTAALAPAASIAGQRLPFPVQIPGCRETLPVAGSSPAPAAEPVADFVRPMAELTPVASNEGRHVPSPVQIPCCRETLPVAGSSPAPAAEPAADFVRPTVALTPVAVLCAQRLPSPLQIPCRQKTPRAAGSAQAPAAEPVAAFVRPTAALTPVAALSAQRLPSPVQIPSRQGLLPAVANSQAPAAEPVAAFVRPTVALTLAAGAIPIQLQQPGIAAEFEPLPVPDEFMETPPMCLSAMPAPAATPVCRFLQCTIASFLAPALHCAAPRFALHIDTPYVPYIVAAQPAAAAEPVITGIYPRAMEVPLASIAATASVLFPEIPGLAQELMPLATQAPTLAAEPVESLLVTAKAAVPVLTSEAGCRVPEAAAFVLASYAPSPALGSAAAGLEPTPLESWLVASAAAVQPSKATARILNLTMAASTDLSATGFDAPCLTPKAAEPRPGSPRAGTLLPISTLSVAAPEQRHERFHVALPQPGILPVEFHAQRLRGMVFARPDWKSPCPATLPPRFVLRPVLEKLGAPAQPKPLRQEPDFSKTIQMPAARKKPFAVLLMAAKIAAGVLVASNLWYGYSAFHGDRRFDAGGEIAGLTTASRSQSPAGGSAAAPAEATQAAPAAKGPVAWVRQNIARRASLQLTENFRSGMQSWGRPGQGRPAGWSRHPDGYIQTGALALFRPSRNFKDYRLEFFGQIESKGMSWSVRAKDPQNYHAMKVSVVEAGLRPFIALVHWDVIDGKAGRQQRTPLNIMVHNDRPIQVAVNVEGKHLVTSIDGEEVDSFTNDTLASGGVGFFSETNERARLYWMKVSKNDDWLGHVCAFLSGDDALRATADLWGPGLPGGAPSPWTPGEEDRTFAAAWAGLPYLRAARRARASNLRRTNLWNT